MYKVIAALAARYSKLIQWIAPPAALVTDTHSVVEFLVGLADIFPLT